MIVILLCRNLMAKQDMAELGFSGVKELDSTEDKNTREYRTLKG